MGVKRLVLRVCSWEFDEMQIDLAFTMKYKIIEKTKKKTLQGAVASNTLEFSKELIAHGKSH